ncbi:MAG: sulfur carrier protein ThiS [Pyrinomonadaceae bacterium]
MLIQINGEARDVPDQITLTELIKHLSLAPERLAVELNHEVVRRARWPDTVLNEGDRLEVVHFVGGGQNSFQF